MHIFAAKNNENTMQAKAHKPNRKSLDSLAARLEVTKEDLLSHCRKAELVDARSMAVALLMSRLGVRQQDVAPLLDISQAAVSKLLARHNGLMRTDKAYKERYEAISR